MQDIILTIVFGAMLGTLIVILFCYFTFKELVKHNLSAGRKAYSAAKFELYGLQNVRDLVVPDIKFREKAKNKI